MAGPVVGVPAAVGLDRHVVGHRDASRQRRLLLRDVPGRDQLVQQSGRRRGEELRRHLHPRHLSDHPMGGHHRSVRPGRQTGHAVPHDRRRQVEVRRRPPPGGRSSATGARPSPSRGPARSGCGSGSRTAVRRRARRERGRRPAKCVRSDSPAAPNDPSSPARPTGLDDVGRRDPIGHRPGHVREPDPVGVAERRVAEPVGRQWRQIRQHGKTVVRVAEGDGTAGGDGGSTVGGSGRRRRPTGGRRRPPRRRPVREAGGTSAGRHRPTGGGAAVGAGNVIVGCGLGCGRRW